MPTSPQPDVIVVGAGVVGCSIAFHLAQSGARVTVFDKGGICAGMSARSGALLRMHYTFPPEAALAWDSLRYFANWGEMVGDSNGACGFVKTGFAIVVGRGNEERLRANIAMLKSLGIDTDLVDARTLHDIDPNVNVEDVALAGYEPRSGYADPVATTRGFADAAARRGATFILHRPVASITAINGTATGVKDAAGRRFDAGAVCVVAGPWSDRLLAPLDRPIGLRAERAQIAFFRRDPAKRHLAYIDTISGSYFRPHEGGLTLAGLGEWREEREPDPDRFREANDAEFVEEVRRRLGSRIPSMRDTEYCRGHAGIYDVSPDSRPVLGSIPGIAGLYVAAGFSGTGFKTSPALGAAMAELILTGASRNIDIGAFSFERLLSGSLIHGANEYTMGAGFGHTL